jgi:hypothetical protein
MYNEQTFSFDGTTVTVRRLANGDVEISGDEFLDKLSAIDDSPEPFDELLINVPSEFCLDFFAALCER